MNDNMEDIFSLLGAVRGCEDDFVGHLKQTAFDGGFFIEDMDFRFRHSSVRSHFTPAKFVEILCLDSIGAVYREYGRAEVTIETGVTVNKGQDVDGELVFLPDIPVQGIRIIIGEDFYRSLQPDIFSRIFSDPEDSDITLGTTSHDPELRLVFGQIKRALERDFRHEPYYKNKITEIIYLLTHPESAKNERKENLKRFSSADIIALNSIKDIIETQISDPPTMAELAKLANASETKLHIDFKTFYGCTIHDYSQRIRMTEALRKMENSDEPIYSIARGVGYNHPGHFTAIFRNTYGVTPSEYVKLKERKHTPMRGRRSNVAQRQENSL
jgi:AraC-like DNA-binding protein